MSLLGKARFDFGPGGEGASPQSSLDDHQLMVLIAAGDQCAFKILMKRHTRSVLAFAQRMTGSPQDAEEILQKAFIAVWYAALKWRADKGARFTTWLYRVVLNAGLDRRRRRPLYPLEEAGERVDPAPGATERLMMRQRHALILHAMKKLPRRQQAALSLHYFHETSVREAAEILEVTVPALESLLIRGKRALKKSLLCVGVTGMCDVS
jgi:RNA polymerase sigma-70 factor (ECF subfamily)